MRCGSLAGTGSPTRDDAPPLRLPPSPRRQSTPAPVRASSSTALSPRPPARPPRPHTAGVDRRAASSTSAENPRSPLRRRRSVDSARLANSRLTNGGSSLLEPQRPGSSSARMAMNKAESLPRGRMDSGDGDIDGLLARLPGDHDVFSSRFGNSSTSLVSRAPTFVSSHSAFTDESSLATESEMASQHGHGAKSRQPRLPASAPIPLRPSLARRRSSTGSLYGEKGAANSSSSHLPVSASVPTPPRTPAFSHGHVAAPFSNLVPVEDAPPKRSRSARSRETSAQDRAAEPPLPPAVPTTREIAELLPPVKKVKRKASLTVRGKYGGDAAPASDLPPLRPPLSANLPSSSSAPPAVPRRSSSSRPSASAASSPAHAPTFEILPVPLPPLPAPSHSSRPCSRGRSKTKGAADGEPPASKTGTLRGSLVKLRKSTASLRSAFRSSSSRQDDPPPSPPPLPPLPARPALQARAPVSRDTSVENLISALQRSDSRGIQSQRRASSRSQAVSPRRSSVSRKSEDVAGFSFAPTASSLADPVPSPPPFASFHPSPADVPPRSPKRASRPRTTSSASPSASPSSRLRRVASTGTVKPRRPPPPLPSLVARLEAKCQAETRAVQAVDTTV